MKISVHRWETLIKLVSEYNCKTIVEVGTARGNNLINITKAFPGSEYKFYAIDPYLPYPGYDSDSNSIPETIQQNYKYAKKYLFCDNRVEHIKDFSVEAAKMFDKESVDLIFIDANHKYDFVKEDLEFWFPILKKGGVFSGHDYSERLFRSAVKNAVDEFCEERGYKPIIHDDVMWQIIK